MSKKMNSFKRNIAKTPKQQVMLPFCELFRINLVE